MKFVAGAAGAQADRASLLTLLRLRSYEKRQVVLASGRTSDFYIDCKKAVLTAEGNYLAGRALWESIRAEAPGCVGVGGLTIGADPLACGVSLLSYLVGEGLLHAFLVRKEPKGHGTGQWIEGLSAFRPGDAVAIVEDVVTSGGSSLRAIERAREAGLNPRGVFALVDREEGGREAIAALGLPTHALFTTRDFV